MPTEARQGGARKHATLLAVPLTRAEPALLDQVRLALAAGADLVELRVDWIGDAAAVARLLSTPAPCPCILTVRAASEGGAWDGTEADRIACYLELGRLGPGLLDIEYSAWSQSENIRQKIALACGAGEAGRRNRLILSYHDWWGTPKDLDAVVQPMLDARPDVVKVVFRTRDATDAWRVLDLLRRRSSEARWIALGLGPTGLLTRVLAPKYGGFLVFAALDPSRTSAPGQPSVRMLRRLYRWDDLGPRTKVFGVVGWPVEHSRSPDIHNAGMSAAGIDGVLVPMPVAPRYHDFAAFMDFLTQRPELDVAGLCVTMPHKSHALRWLRQRGFSVTEVAARAGAVNTLTRGPDGWQGDNTDVVGIMSALREPGRRLLEAGRREALVLGAGGAARAAVVALQALGFRVTVCNRTPARAQALAGELGCQVAGWEERTRTEGDVVINATSLGMEPRVQEVPLPASALKRGTVVFDLVYTPAETRLLGAARDQGCEAISGVELFVEQAAAQFERWHGGPAPKGVFRNVLGA